jgi:tripartite-type tricarboxylate transporter receptor subunit TctC
MKNSTARKLAAFFITSLGILLASPMTLAQEPVSFAGKTLTVIVGSPAGGGTDASARLIASLLASYLPGQPAAMVRNIPGAQGITAMNYFVKQVVPDGLTLMSASTTQADPLLYRKPQSQFDPTTYSFVGGVGRGGTVMLIRKDAEPRLYDKRTAPVIMGALGGVPRSGMLTTAWGIEYLDWNAKWVVGYRGTSELMIALERGEIDMTSTGNLFQIQKFLNTGRFKILSQSGTLQKGRPVPRPEFGEAAVFANLMKGKIGDPTVQKAFDYWSTMTSLDKWIALPPRTPEAMVRAHRAAYEAASAGTDFAELGKKISEDLEPMGHDDVTSLIQRLGGTTSEAVNAIGAILRKQGIEAE